MFGDPGLCGLLEEGAHGKSPKCLGGNLGDFREFCKGLYLPIPIMNKVWLFRRIAILSGIKKQQNL